MVEVSASVRADAPLEAVWGVVSDLGSEPRYWKGTLSARTLSEEGGTVRREVVLAFRNRRCIQDVTLEPMRRVRAVFREGPIRGSKLVDLREEGGAVEVTAVWDITLAGLPAILSGMLARHIRKGTERALRAIRDEAEGRARGAGG